MTLVPESQKIIIFVMKFSTLKTFRLTLWLILILSPVLFSACSKSDDSEIPGNSKIEKVLLVPEQEEGYGGYYYDVHTPFVFFKNGRFIRSPYIPINEINADKYIAGQGEAVGTWAVTGGKVTVTFESGNKKTFEWSDYVGYPPNSGQTLSGSYETISGGGTIAVGGEIGIMRYTNMSFTKDGWYTTEKVASTESSTNAAYKTSKTSGKYTLNADYSITLKANNGQEKKLFFCWYDSKKTRVFRLAGRTFSPEN